MAVNADNARDKFIPAGGQFQDLVGSNVDTVTPTPTHMVHHITTDGTLTTITPPAEGFTGPIYLIADSVFDWTTSGNIAAAPGTTLLANNAYGFLYDRRNAKWYPFGATP
jgi:hypothetical protein